MDYEHYTPFPLKKLVYLTRHLPHYDDLDKIIALGGKEYTVIKKALWYHIVGGVLKIPVKIGDIETDTRISIFYPIKSGRGKNNLVQACKFSAITSNKSHMSPSSLHPEQLVGKTKTSKSGEVKHIYGVFKNDFIQFDESSDMLQAKSSMYKESLSYIRIALDPIGRNVVTKKMVDIDNVNALSYEPTCSIMMLSQPVYVSNLFVSLGTFRRFITPYVVLESLPQNEVNKILMSKIEGRDDTIDAKKEWSVFLNNIKNYSGNFTITEDGKELLLKSNNEISSVMNSWSKKGQDYAAMMQFSMTDMILKLSSILCALDNRFNITSDDVMKAHMDLFEFVCHGLTYLESRIYGDIDTGESWGGVKNEEDREVIEWLIERGSTNEENSNISKQEVLEFISDNFNLTEHGATRRYKKFKKMGWLKSKQVGQYGSVVWTEIEEKLGWSRVEVISNNSPPLYSYIINQGNDLIKGVVPDLNQPKTNEISDCIVNKEPEKPTKVKMMLYDYEQDIVDFCKGTPKPIQDIVVWFRTLEQNQLFSNEKITLFLYKLRDSGVLLEETPNRFRSV